MPAPLSPLWRRKKNSRLKIFYRPALVLWEISKKFSASFGLDKSRSVLLVLVVCEIVVIMHINQKMLFVFFIGASIRIKHSDKGRLY